jgi:hypothetical protein
MFDYIKCDYPLPFPEEILKLKPQPDWKEVEFQTKSLHNTLNVYTIEEDGQIYKELIDREVTSDEMGTLILDETPQGIEKVDHTGEIDFYTVHADEGYDYWMEFSALFWKGDLKELDLKEFKKEDNAGRLEVQAQMETELKERDKKAKQNKGFFRRNFIKLVRVSMFLIRWTIGKIAQLTWKIERLLLK